MHVHVWVCVLTRGSLNVCVCVEVAHRTVQAWVILLFGRHSVHIVYRYSATWSSSVPSIVCAIHRYLCAHCRRDQRLRSRTNFLWKNSSIPPLGDSDHNTGKQVYRWCILHPASAWKWPSYSAARVVNLYVLQRNRYALSLWLDSLFKVLL